MKEKTVHGSLALDGAVIFKTPFFSRYQKFLSFGNSNGSKTSPKMFLDFFSTSMAAGGFQSFCILEGTTDPLIEQ